MRDAHPDRLFAGAIPQLYERYLVPLIFDPYASDLAARIAPLEPMALLEIAAGTGVLTRYLSAALPATSAIVATDLNQAMLDEAMAHGTQRPLEWQQADAQALPFADAAFDAVVCQFGAMFFPDKVRAFGEARRVLRRGGLLLFNVWDAIGRNEFTHAVAEGVAEFFPLDPPRFLQRVPHGYHAIDAIAADLASAGFTRTPEFATLVKPTHAASPRIPAVGFCQATPLRNEIEARAKGRLAEATEAAMQEVALRFGPGPIEGQMQAIVVSVKA
jgi:SAM-dependent methyltransferase